MDQLIQLMNSPLFKYLVYYWVFSALASALPSPAITATKIRYKPFLIFYSGVFTVVHLIAGSLSRLAVAFKIPGATEPELPPTS